MSKTDAEIYANVGKHRRPYVDEPRPPIPPKRRSRRSAEVARRLLSIVRRRAH